MKAITDTTVVVGMSGGVDSSVTALLLKQQGYRVIGLFMRNWEETKADGSCNAVADYDDVTEVCRQIGIPHYTVNFSQQYMDRVFSGFIEDLKKGYTPNPDVLCNREIKFELLLEKALEMGADYLATGHYCRNEVVEGKNCLLRGLDESKDQSYFLYTIKGTKLAKTLFPIGHLPKTEVRRIAAENGLATSTKKDSTGICFIGKRDFKDFIKEYIPYSKGNFEDLDGKVVGTHDGVAYYTIGQRRGLAIGGAGDAWFVVEKDVARNVVVVTQGSDHPALYKSELIATEVSWVNDAPMSLPYRCTAKIRYRQPDAACTIVKIEGDTIEVVFDKPQKAITSKQSVVFYQGDVCLGGAIIT